MRIVVLIVDRSAWIVDLVVIVARNMFRLELTVVPTADRLKVAVMIVDRDDLDLITATEETSVESERRRLGEE